MYTMHLYGIEQEHTSRLSRSMDTIIHYINITSNTVHATTTAVCSDSIVKQIKNNLSLIYLGQENCQKVVPNTP